LILHAIGSIPFAWVENIPALLVLRFLTGVGGQGYYQIAFILGMPSYHVIVLHHIRHVGQNYYGTLPYVTYNILIDRISLT